METVCSCGARLVEGALFCHRCGKPTRVNEAAEVQEPPAVPEIRATTGPAEAAEPQPIGFRNALAVRVSVLAASVGYMLTTVTAMMAQAVGLPALQVLAMVGSALVAGGFAAYLYRRRSGRPVASSGGARIGWMTGVFAFVLTTILLTLGVVLLSGEGGFASIYQQSLSAMQLPEEAKSRIKELLENPAAMAFLIVVILALQFMFMTLLSAVGGALGARLLNQGRSN